MQRLVSLLEEGRPETGPYLVGVTGGVAAGKSTLTAALAGVMQGSPSILSTDSFLWPNVMLEEHGLTMEKGFPHTYDVESLRAAVGALGACASVSVPSYSHRTYDIDPEQRVEIGPTDLVLVDGLHLSRFAGDLLGSVVYLHADEADIERWYVERFLELVAGAERDPASFYRLFLGPEPDALAEIARQLWSTINLVNLREHIAPWRDRADLVVVLDGEHRIVDIQQP